ncbi:hypothetical protein EJ110_NYTH21271 [Nymphaea thermarum]|nr:hypothetical protein EJ110_NYTH21271 [Nymphaea thermarum]
MTQSLDIYQLFMLPKRSLRKLNIPRAAFWPASAWMLFLLFKIPTLIDAGVIDLNGGAEPMRAYLGLKLGGCQTPLHSLNRHFSSSSTMPSQSVLFSQPAIPGTSHLRSGLKTLAASTGSIDNRLAQSSMSHCEAPRYSASTNLSSLHLGSSSLEDHSSGSLDLPLWTIMQLCIRKDSWIELQGGHSLLIGLHKRKYSPIRRSHVS